MRFHAPTGQNTGSTVATWLFRLHMADIKALGLPYRIFVTLLGIVIAFLSVSGVWIWLKKRRKKKSSRKNVKNLSQQNEALNGSERENKKPIPQTSVGKKVGEL
ncbi:MAG: PepSY-associated TM helix domain-containing protein [Cyclobacteriaceae bacterium]